MQKIIPFCILLLVNIYCRKATDNFVPATSICVTVRHHEQFIAEGRVYLQQAGETFVGWDEAQYDTLLYTDRRGRGCINGLPFGRYWLMAKEFDYLVNDSVFGKTYIEILPHHPTLDTILYVAE